MYSMVDRLANVYLEPVLHGGADPMVIIEIALMGAMFASPGGDSLRELPRDLGRLSRRDSPPRMRRRAMAREASSKRSPPRWQDC